jgi:hypothetical protein
MGLDLKLTLTCSLEMYGAPHPRERKEAKRQPSRNPDFLCNLLPLAHFMRLSLTKAAHADFGSARVQEIPRRVGALMHGDSERRRCGTEPLGLYCSATPT